MELKLSIIIQAENLHLLFLLKLKRVFNSFCSVTAHSNVTLIQMKFSYSTAIFTYGIEDDIQPRWTWQKPDSIIDIIQSRPSHYGYVHLSQR